MKKTLSILVLILLIAVGGYYFYQTQRKSTENTDKKTEKEVIKIGAILPLTGPGSTFANYIKKGINLALKDSKSKAIEFRVIFEDSQNKPSIGVSSYKKLVEKDKVDVIIVALSSVAEAIKKFGEIDKIPQIGIAVATPLYTENNDYIYRVYPNANTMAGRMANYSIDSLKCKNFGIIYINDAFGRASKKAYTQISDKNSKKILLSESYNLTQKDFKGIITKINKLKPECIYLNGYGPAYSSFIKQLYSMKNYNFKFTADMSLGLPIVKKQIRQVKDTLYYVDGKINNSFKTHFKKTYDSTPTSYSGYAYDIISILEHTLEINKENTNVSEKIQKNLYKINKFNGVMGNISILKNGDCNLEFLVKKINNK